MPIQIAYTEVERLIRKFKGLSAPARKAYNEDNTRKDFILPLFRALEWDTQDSAQVSAEEKVSRGWVDFSFRIGGVPRFFLETKRIAEDLTRPQWVRQAMDYAWTKGVTWALLSDFEGLRVFNAEWKEDNPLRAQFIDFGVDTYLADFERLWWLSRPQTAAGTLDREAEKVGKKARREPVSQHLFDDLKTWRQFLYKNVRASNPLWSPAQLDAAVLRLLNRLIFLRAAEDRQVEPPLLRPLLRELRDQRRLRDLWPELEKIFRRADATYDSQLFEIGLVDNLKWDSSPLEVLIEGLYGKQFLLYNFNAIDADVLGTAYEQYLGHIITDTPAPLSLSLGPAEAAEVVEKRAKRKSQGIFYTPTFVVKYIVSQTLGRYLDEHGYNPGRPVRILDMACGSGSFLIEAFDVLDRHVAEMRGDLTPRPPLRAGEGEAAAAMDFRDHARQMELLTGCIYGVDKDEQAVAVARLNLLLKALHTRDRLPMLANIRCGDSLVSGTADELQAAFGPDWRDKRPFNWGEEFPEVFSPLPKSGEGAGGEAGFDVIIGNPPYIRAENMPRDERDYYISSGKFEASYGRFDIHVLFVERAIKLLKPGGRLGFIIPYAGLSQNYGQAMRNLILNTCVLETIVDLSDYRVFTDASVATCIVILRKESDERARISNQVRIIKQETYDCGILSEASFLDQRVFSETPHSTFRLDLDARTLRLLRKIEETSLDLGDICYLITGAVLHDPATGASKERLIHREFQEGYRPYIEAKELSRYLPPKSQRFLDISKPSEMHRPKFAELFENEKLMIARIASQVTATLDGSHLYTDHTVNLAVRKDHLLGIKNRSVSISEKEAKDSREYSLKYLLGLINSSLATFYLRRLLGMAIEINPETARRLPIRCIDFSNPADVARHDRIVALVDEMLALQREHAAAQRAFGDAREGLARRIAAVDAAIDREVYALYGLTEAEIEIVEGR